MLYLSLKALMSDASAQTVHALTHNNRDGQMNSPRILEECELVIITSEKKKA